MKIRSLRSLGVRQTYSPEMRSSQHNYITGNSSVVHKNSHAVAYCLWAYLSLWLKTHYREEWLAAVIGHCHPDKIVRYMTSARSESISFGEIDIERMTVRPVAHSGKNAIDGTPSVAIGLINLKGVGESLALSYADDVENVVNPAPVDGYTNIDHFVQIKGAQKTMLERLIKLGAFRKMHPNIRATWMWYLHNYCNGDVDVDGEKIKVSTLKKRHEAELLKRADWTSTKVEEERQRQIAAYKALYPKRNVIPAKILKWQPKPSMDRASIMSLYDDDYSLKELLEFEKSFLGYYWHSPCDLYNTSPDCTIEHAKLTGRLEGVITRVMKTRTRTDKEMMKLFITDGQDECLVILWENEMKNQDHALLTVDMGVRLLVAYDIVRDSFVLARGSSIERLWSMDAWEEMREKTEF